VVSSLYWRAIDARLGTPDPARDPGELRQQGPPLRQLRALMWKHGTPEYKQLGLNPKELVERLEKRLAEAITLLQEKDRALTEARAQATETLEQQTATSDILRLIGTSPTDAQPVFDGIAHSAVTVLGALGCAVFRIDEDMVDVAAVHNVRPERIACHELLRDLPGQRWIQATAHIDRRQFPMLAGTVHAKLVIIGERSGHRRRIARRRTYHLCR